MDIPISLITSYAIFSIFLFYQQLHLKKFRGASDAFGALLGIFALVAMLFSLGFLGYWGYKVSWLQAVMLFSIAFAIKVLWFPIEAKLGLGNAYWVFSLTGFVVLPVSGYFMSAALP